MWKLPGRTTIGGLSLLALELWHKLHECESNWDSGAKLIRMQNNLCMHFSLMTMSLIQQNRHKGWKLMCRVIVHSECSQSSKKQRLCNTQREDASVLVHLSTKFLTIIKNIDLHTHNFVQFSIMCFTLLWWWTLFCMICEYDVWSESAWRCGLLRSVN